MASDQVPRGRRCPGGGRMTTPERRQILCVDDEPHILSGIALNLRRRYEVLCAQSGTQGLELLKRHPDIAVIITDMRMPGMDGAQFLVASREIRPDAGRILLTGYSDITHAIAAVNSGRICRFLTKPCAADQLIEAIESAIEEHEAAIARRAGKHGNRNPIKQYGATGLSSREYFLEVFEQTLAERQLVQAAPGSLFLVEFQVAPAAVGELDSFANEIILRTLADRLRERCVDQTCMAVWDARRIALYVADCTGTNEGLKLGHDLVDVALRPVETEDGEVIVDVCVGVVEIPPAILDSKTVLRQA